MITGASDICARRGWTLHGAGSDATHEHFLISWRGYFPCDEVQRVLKNILSLMLGRLVGQRGRRWFVTDGNYRRVAKREHFDYLINTYFPDHAGRYWREGQPLPEVPSHVLGDDRGASAPGYKKSPKFPKKKRPPRTRYNKRDNSK